MWRLDSRGCLHVRKIDTISGLVDEGDELLRNNSMTLAIVDDDEDVRQALARLLRSLGHLVHVFGSAEEFESATVAVDCLILDVRLPGLSGPELRERLRRGSTPTPVVLITGDCDPKARDIFPAIDTPSLTKPFDDVTLMAAIDDAIASADVPRERHAY
jgi:FixJ family two-component response regulator